MNGRLPQLLTGGYTTLRNATQPTIDTSASDTDSNDDDDDDALSIYIPSTHSAPPADSAGSRGCHSTLSSLCWILLYTLTIVLFVTLVFHRTSSPTVHRLSSTQSSLPSSCLDQPSISSTTESSQPYPARSTSRHAVIGTAVGYSFAHVSVFIRSLRTHCPHCQLILFVNTSQLTPYEVHHFTHFHTQLIDVDQLSVAYQRDTDGAAAVMEAKHFMQAAHSRWVYNYDYMRTILSNSSHPLPYADRLSLSQRHNPITADIVRAARQRAYSSVISGGGDAYGVDIEVPSDELSTSITHVFFCDVRDLLFQRNVFNFLPYRHQFAYDDLPPAREHVASSTAPAVGSAVSAAPTNVGVFVFTEDVQLMNESTNVQWVGCARPDLLVPARPVLNSGTTLASAHESLLWLDALLATLYNYSDCALRLTGFDQGAHQIAVWSNAIAPAPVYVIPTSRGPVANMQGMELVENEYGELVNECGSVYAVCHQYDRVEELVRAYVARYPMSGADEKLLRKKSWWQWLVG